MKKIFLLLLISAALVACVSNGKPVKGVIPDSRCGDSTTGKTDTVLKYGKDDIVMKWKSHVREHSEFRIKLRPRKGYDSKKVKIVGISGTLPGGAGTTSPDWLNIEKSAKELKKAHKKAILVLCVPKGIPENTEYKFDVRIEDIGNLDPRVRVTY